MRPSASTVARRTSGDGSPRPLATSPMRRAGSSLQRRDRLPRAGRGSAVSATSARAASAPCRSWRRAILASPSIAASTTSPSSSAAATHCKQVRASSARRAGDGRRRLRPRAATARAREATLPAPAATSALLDVAQRADGRAADVGVRRPASGSRTSQASGGPSRPSTSIAASRTCGAGSCRNVVSTAGTTRASPIDPSDSKREVADPRIGIVTARCSERVDRGRWLHAQRAPPRPPARTDGDCVLAARAPASAATRGSSKKAALDRGAADGFTRSRDSTAAPGRDTPG